MSRALVLDLSRSEQENLLDILEEYQDCADAGRNPEWEATAAYIVRTIEYNLGMRKNIEDQARDEGVLE